MSGVPHIDCSPGGERSHSRHLTKEFITGWLDDQIIYRDLGHHPVPFVTEAWVAGTFTTAATHSDEAKATLAFSDRLIDAFLSCNRYVIGVPMYNFGIPANLKAYIDQIVRVGRTFLVDPQTGTYEGLAKNKKMLVSAARGGSYPKDTPMAQFDLQESYIRTGFSFMGVTDISFIYADNLNMRDKARQKSLAAASHSLQQSLVTW
ncbi:acyl carrier protein phosphodiesterase [Synechococcus sp. PCC 7502]|uniref:FMN-dependent NADH-azoreductase n=1 Tax=Synechococcus sp. PCC 7502 TaxID=1173263 RepID=UPI00029F9B32|nr:NAD(P)H-dependent oxidoreductase [Synechococcus sp. PCC 7502]AFY75071.1 acyl carrier protein phosphodiesterase [Synechococcus sp. PCC 7502]